MKKALILNKGFLFAWGLVARLRDTPLAHRNKDLGKNRSRDKQGNSLSLGLQVYRY